MEDIIEQRLGIRRRVLVVDDEKVNRELLGKILERDYELLFAEDGEEALSSIRENADSLSMVLLDLSMPKKDGFEVLSVIKQSPLLSRIPVIVLTSDKSAEVRSLKEGAADFITKPYDLPEVILARVGRCIALSEDNSIIRATQYDHLTGLFTTEFFMEYAHLHDANFPAMQMDAVALNINRFRLLNEIYGRAFGDQLLKRIADRLREISKRSRGIASRMGEDMFLAYLPHIEDVQGFFAEMMDSYSDLLNNPGMRIRIGIYPNVDFQMDMERRFDRAKSACNSIRNNLSGQIAIYNQAFHEKETYDARLMDDVERALSEHQFMVYYQPKFNIQGEKPVLSSAEALIRWKHPEFGMIRPDVFVPLFEEHGLVGKLDRFVWREAAAQMKRWREQYGYVVPVSVNVSRIDILSYGFMEEISGIVEENGLEPADLYLEVTESAYTEDAERIITVVEALRKKGFRIEMDDFGSGYSSLNMLSSLPIDVLKLDMKFIRNIHKNPRDFGLVELVLGIARFLDAVVVAEGVENEEQYKLLKGAGCDVIQGFYFSRPVPPEEFEQFLSQKKR